MLLRAGAKSKTATAHKQSNHKDQATRINVDVEALHFAATATKEEDYQQYPRAVASAAALFAVAAAVTFVEHSVEHSLPPFAEISALVFDLFQSLLHNMEKIKFWLLALQ